MSISNSYEDARRAETYARLEFPGTYYLAYRDLPKLVADHATGGRALDFGCGTGRSTRFLKELGYDTLGVDIAKDMIRQAKERDPDGAYRQIADGDFGSLEGETFDLILSVFTFDNIPTRDKKIGILNGLRNLLASDGTLISLVSSPEIYLYEWASFSTKDFPENESAKSGDTVRIIITDTEDQRPVEDIVWSDEDYRSVYDEAGLAVVDTHRPLARDDEPYPWVNETRIPPWVIYLLRAK